MLDTIEFFEKTLQRTFADLDIVCHNVTSISGKTIARLRQLMHGGMFEVCARLADCIHHIAFVVVPKLVRSDAKSTTEMEAIIESFCFSSNPHGWETTERQDPLLLLIRLLHHLINSTVPKLFDQLPQVRVADTRAEDNVDRGDDTEDEDNGSSEEHNDDGSSRCNDTSTDKLLIAAAASRDIKDAIRLYAELRDLLLARYCRGQSVIFRDLVSFGISRSGMVWADCARPSKLRDYVTNILLHCVNMHADSVQIAPAQLQQILSSALETICGTFRDEVDLVAPELALHSAEQLNVELNFITSTLDQYETTVSAGRARMCRTLLSQKRLASTQVSYHLVGTVGYKHSLVCVSVQTADTRDNKMHQNEIFDSIHRAAEAATEVAFACFRSVRCARRGLLVVVCAHLPLAAAAAVRDAQSRWLSEFLGESPGCEPHGGSRPTRRPASTAANDGRRRSHRRSSGSAPATAATVPAAAAAIAAAAFNAAECSEWSLQAGHFASGAGLTTCCIRVQMAGMSAAAQREKHQHSASVPFSHTRPSAPTVAAGRRTVRCYIA
jgi:hypothetical protein